MPCSAVNFENFGHTTKISHHKEQIIQLVKLLADLSTRLMEEKVAEPEFGR